ncbi:MAG: M28 family metallopeptidase [Firmicutes bacterium]|nr:M28 family metallopeptidase [Bacillota bacterium]
MMAKEYSLYAEQEIKHICENFKDRYAGSKTELAANQYLEGQIKSNNWADWVQMQSFKVQPHAFMLFSKVIPIMMIIAAALFFLVPIASLALSALSLFFLFTQLIFYWEVLDFFLPKKYSHNLVATKRPAGKVKRRIIFGGHIDAAFEWSLFVWFGHIIAKIISVISVIGILFTLAISIVIVSGVADHWWMYIAVGWYAVAYLAIFFFSNFNKVVDGANDNMTGTMVSVAILKYMAENNLAFENTEVISLITGSEEAGLRGAKAFVKTNQTLLRDPDVETVFIALETFRDDDHFAIMTKDMNGLVRADKRAINLLDKACTELLDNPLPHKSIPLGSSDAAAFSKGKIPAVCLAAMNPRPSRFYHTRYDTADNLDVNCIQKAFDICVKSLEIFDKNGLL